MTDNRIIFYEKIEDRVGYLQEWTNPCQHIKYREYGINRPRTLMSDTCAFAVDQGVLPDIYGVLVSGIPALPPNSYQELASQAYEHFVTAVKPEVKLLNLILEMVSTLKGAESKIKTASKLAIQARLKFKKLYDLFIKKGLTEPEASFLAWSFAIKPLIGDLQKILCSVEKARKRLKFLVDHEGVPVRIHFRRKNVMELSPSTALEAAAGSYIYGGWNPTCPPWVFTCAQPEREQIRSVYRIRPMEFDITFCAQALVVYKLPPFRFKKGTDDGLSLVWGAMMYTDRIGSVIWEAIPFSFIIDWITDLGKQLADWLDNKTRIFPDGEIRAVGHSFKLTSKWKVTAESDLCGTTESLGKCSLTRYQRAEGLPFNSTYTFNIGGLTTPYHSALITALTIQKVRAVRRRRKFR